MHLNHLKTICPLSVGNLSSMKLVPSAKMVVDSCFKVCCCCSVTSVVSDSVRPHRQQPTRPHLYIMGMRRLYVNTMSLYMIPEHPQILLSTEGAEINPQRIPRDNCTCLILHFHMYSQFSANVTGQSCAIICHVQLSS